ncbi:MAG: hypothetical protein IIY00_05135 [Clostridia bacterium]|nr:hypothetical protein [Clostridia bacterium]
MSETRKKYIIRLIFRMAALGICVWAALAHPEAFVILEGNNFWKGFSPFHILWMLWVVDMLQQIIPVKNKVPLGSQKLWENRFRPIRDRMNWEGLRRYIISTTEAAYKVAILWILFTAAIGIGHRCGLYGRIGLFLITVFFYVCDLICVLIWCPFRLMMKTRCCTTCRIFNWDHLMMFSPMLFMGGFYGISLLVLSIAAWLVWELCIMLYPERFWEGTNVALRCSECTDKLCTQYCRKLRKTGEK